jgi:hypothetical protein
MNLDLPEYGSFTVWGSAMSIDKGASGNISYQHLKTSDQDSKYGKWVDANTLDIQRTCGRLDLMVIHECPYEEKGDKKMGIPSAQKCVNVLIEKVKPSAVVCGHHHIKAPGEGYLEFSDIGTSKIYHAASVGGWNEFVPTCAFRQFYLPLNQDTGVSQHTGGSSSVSLMSPTHSPDTSSGSFYRHARIPQPVTPGKEHMYPPTNRAPPEPRYNPKPRARTTPKTRHPTPQRAPPESDTSLTSSKYD